MKGLDAYLTSPDDGFDGWADSVVENHTYEFYDLRYKFIQESSPNGQYNQWLFKLFRKCRDPKQSAQIIERAHSIYKKNKVSTLM